MIFFFLNIVDIPLPFQFYSRMPSGELQAVRYSVLNYLQGLAVRVSLYLKHGLQDMHGRLIVPKDGPVPPGQCWARTQIPASPRRGKPLTLPLCRQAASPRA